MKNILLSFLVVLWLPNGVAAFGIGLTPTTVEMSINPAEQKRQVIRVGNVNKQKSLALTVGLADWSLDETGQLQLFPPGSQKRSPASWIRFSPASFTLSPGSLKEIIVDIAPPVRLDEAGDYRVALLVSTLLPDKKNRPQQSGVWNRHQVATLFYLTVSPSKSKPEIESLGYRFLESGEIIFSTLVNNSGNSHARLKGEISLLDRQGELALALPVQGVVLEAQQRKLESRFDATGLAKGDYGVKMSLENLHVPQVMRGREPVEINITMPVLSIK